MKLKVIMILFFLFILSGCSKEVKEVQIETIIDENAHYKVSINYPKTGYEKVDKEIYDYIDDSYQSFLKKQSTNKALDTLEELNIDYTYFENNDIISITLFKVQNNEQEMKTYNYMLKNIESFSIENITSQDMVLKKANTILFKRFGNTIDINLVEKNLETPLFSIDQENLYLYYPPKTFSNTYSDFIIIDIPLEELDITFEKIQKTSIEVYENQINTEKVNSIIDTNSKVIALTFDDGPSGYTEEIISILKENDAVATFFLLGNKVTTYQEVLKKSIEHGNELGNHTYNHKWLTKLSDGEIKKQIEDTQTIIKDTLGYTPKIFRPSYGSINKRVRNDIDLKVVLWNIDTMDWKYKSVDKIIDRAVRNASDESIILMHETYERTKDALPKIISILKEKGFTFVTISELEEVRNLRKLNG